MELTLFIFLASVLATSQAATTPHQIHLLRPHSGASGHHVSGINCLSWRLAVETDNIRNWDVVPEACENYVGHYMLGHQYRKDCNVAGYYALQYAKSLKLAGDGKDIWVFDIDETALSNLPYYARPENGFGAKEFNETSFNEWIEEGIAPPVPAVLKLYQKLLPLGFKIVFISGTSEKYRKTKISNLKLAGYHTWEKLILKATSESGATALVYKSERRKELVEAGYRILGNMGDQWSDLFGTYVGNRTFKFKPEEITGIMKDFDEPGFLAPTGLHLGGTKYMVIQGEAGAVIRGKKGSGGVTIKKTGQALIFGLYDEPVTPGQCNMIVERMGDYLIDQGL